MRFSEILMVAAQGSGGVDDGALWAAAVVANGGTVSAGRLIIVQTFIAAEKAAGIWPLVDDYWPLWGENEPQALTSLKQRRLCTLSATPPTFAADRGYTGNGSSSHIRTGFIIATHAIAMTVNSLRLAAYERVNVGTFTNSMGSSAFGIAYTLYAKDNSNKMNSQLRTAANATTAVVPTSLGYSAASANTTGPVQNYYKNGALFESKALAMTGVLPNVDTALLARNVAGTIGAFRATQLGFACTGAELSAGQETSQYNNVQAWATSIGANV